MTILDTSVAGRVFRTYIWESKITGYLAEIATNSDIAVEWDNIKKCNHKTAFEVLGTYWPYKRKKGLKIWNEEVAQAVKEKKRAFVYRWLSTKIYKFVQRKEE